MSEDRAFESTECICKNCNSVNNNDSMFCDHCGGKLESQAAETKMTEISIQTSLEAKGINKESTSSDQLAFPSKSDMVKEIRTEDFIEAKPKNEDHLNKKNYEDEIPSVFAMGLPEWDMVPPNIPVKRRGVL